MNGLQPVGSDGIVRSLSNHRQARALYSARMTPAMRRTVIALAAVLGVAYAVLTPPFEVPDEVFHFWRPLVIAAGQLMPQRRGAPDAGAVPLGAQNLVFVMTAQKRGETYTREQMDLAMRSPLEPARLKTVRFPAWY